MQEDETIEETASDQEQPVQDAVSDETQVEVPTETVATEASDTEQPSPVRHWAGKYQSPEELERAYLESTREASRMAGELAAMRKTPTGPSTTDVPEYKKLEKERNLWAQQLRNAATDTERWQADEQVRLYDRAIAKAEAKHEWQTESSRQNATQTLETESQAVIKQYEADLNNMSSPLYQAAVARVQTLLQAGYPDNNATKALAVAYAAVTTGQGAKQAVQQDRGQLLKTIKTNLKQSVQAGAGGPAAIKSGAITAEDINKMSEKDFAAYERRLLGVQ